MNFRDIDFSKRFPVNFLQNVQIPLFPQLRKSRTKAKSTNRNESSNILPKMQSINISKNASFTKSHHQNNRLAAWSEIVIPFSRSLKPRSYHSSVFYDNR